MKKKRLSMTIIIVLLIAGLSLILYPTISDFLRSRAYRDVITEYRTAVEALDEESYEAILEAAIEYNERLAAANEGLRILTEKELEEYESLLNFSGNGVMGYVVIPKIDVSLPIYHGTTAVVLQSGAGHLEGTSLPIGGESTHAVLSGHRGLPSATLFSDLDQLTEGDTFTVHVLKEVLLYEVDQITVVQPPQWESLLIEPGKDYCTLLTCTPYGVNTHRLLVRGHRIETPEDLSESEWESGVNSAPEVGIFVTLVVVVLLIVILRRRKSRRKRNPV